MFVISDQSTNINTSSDVRPKVNEDYFILKATLKTKFGLGKEIIIVDNKLYTVKATLVERLSDNHLSDIESSFLIITKKSSISKLLKMKSPQILPVGSITKRPSNSNKIKKVKHYEINY